MIDIIDVTLRDGGHAVDFDWPIAFAREYYNLMCSLTQIKTIELGYWGQTSKSNNYFYNLNSEKVSRITDDRGLKNVSIMIDYHYCSHNIKDFPNVNNKNISMIRMCARKNDLKKALEFGKALKEHCGIGVSFNIFNASNYTAEEINRTIENVLNYPFDYVYFADTHGNMDLTKDWGKFEFAVKLIKDANRLIGFHLHDHSGLAMSNYKELIKRKIDSTDTSVRGMGKGSGNLKLEHVIDKRVLHKLAQFILENDKLLHIRPLVYELITAKYSLTDNYAKQANELQIDLVSFDEICKTISGLDKDNFTTRYIK